MPITFFFLAALCSTANAQEKNSGRLFAGAAKVDITPPLGETIVGSFAPFPAENIHDRLHARCLVLKNNDTSVAFVICDNLGIPKSVYEDARKAFAKTTEIPPGNVLMAATHTHSATRAASPKYQPQLAAGIAEAVRRAEANLQPAAIGWGGVNEPTEVFNRRWRVRDPDLRKNPFGGVDEVRMNPPRGHASLIKPAGPIDPEVSILSVQTTDGRPLALLANYSLHYVGGVERGSVSADYFGIFSQRMGDMLKASDSQPEFIAMMSNGTSGDINNINFRVRTPKQPPYAKMTQVAELLAKRVADAYSQIEHHDWVPLGAATKDLILQVRKPDKRLQDYFQELRKQPDDAPMHHRYGLVYADRVQRLLEGPDEITVPIQAIRIGDLGIAAIPFETFAEIGLDIKKRSPFDDAFTIELANDSRGYLPTPEQHALGGYETWMGTNRVEKTASGKIAETVLALMAELKGATAESKDAAK